MKRYIAASTSSVFSTWNEAYDLIGKVVDMYAGGFDEASLDIINKKVEVLNSIFKSDPNWDEAYHRWIAFEDNE